MPKFEEKWKFPYHNEIGRGDIDLNNNANLLALKTYGRADEFMIYNIMSYTYVY